MGELDLRKNIWREAIIKIAEAVEETPLTVRALAILIADSTGVTMTQARLVLEAIPQLKERYLKLVDCKSCYHAHPKSLISERKWRFPGDYRCAFGYPYFPRAGHNCSEHKKCTGE